tara:strand:+ start:1058 stop:1786 length:729 start_codon:yes stop_codon:yes gene_type:complete
MGVEGALPFDFAVFADTQDEPAPVYENMWHLACLGGPPIVVGSRGSLSAHCLDGASGNLTSVKNPPLFTPSTDRSHGMLRRKCTEDFKIAVIRSTVRRWLGIAPRGAAPKVVMLLGITTDEAQRMKPSRVKWIEHSYPLIDLGMSRSDCHAWFRDRNLASPPKSSCWHCPYRSDAEWKRLKMSSPNDFQRAVDFDRSIRQGFKGMSAPAAFVHSSLTPLDEVDFSDSQFELFGDECAGVCGV